MSDAILQVEKLCKTFSGLAAVGLLLTPDVDHGRVPAPADSDSALSPVGRLIIAAIDALPDAEREAFDLVRIQGMTQVEAATVLGVSTMTVKRRLNSGVQLLADLLADLGPQGIDPGAA